MAGVPDTENVFAAELLSTGVFSDVTVRCEGREWNLHKAILCKDSTFFRKELTGNWAEANSDRVTIESEDPNHLDWIIKLMYNMNPFESASFKPEEIILGYGDLFAIAVYLGVQRGVTWATESLSAALALKAKSIQDTYYTKVDDFDEEAYGTLDFIQALFYTADMAYDEAFSTFQPLRDVFVDFFRKTRYIAIRHPTYRQGLMRVPELARDVLLELVPERIPRPERLSQTLLDRQATCRLCNVPVERYFTDHWNSVGGFGTNGICTACNQDSERRIQCRRRNYGLVY